MKFNYINLITVLNNQDWIWWSSLFLFIGIILYSFRPLRSLAVIVYIFTIYIVVKTKESVVVIASSKYDQEEENDDDNPFRGE